MGEVWAKEILCSRIQEIEMELILKRQTWNWKELFSCADTNEIGAIGRNWSFGNLRFYLGSQSGIRKENNMRWIGQRWRHIYSNHSIDSFSTVGNVYIHYFEIFWENRFIETFVPFFWKSFRLWYRSRNTRIYNIFIVIHCFGSLSGGTFIQMMFHRILVFVIRLPSYHRAQRWVPSPFCSSIAFHINRFDEISYLFKERLFSEAFMLSFIVHQKLITHMRPFA